MCTQKFGVATWKKLKENKKNTTRYVSLTFLPPHGDVIEMSALCMTTTQVQRTMLETQNLHGLMSNLNWGSATRAN